MNTGAAYTVQDPQPGFGVGRAMKVCPHCGDTYRDHVDFCFGDGEVLVLSEATASTTPSEADLDPPLPRRIQGGQLPWAEPEHAQAQQETPSGAAPPPLTQSDHDPADIDSDNPIDPGVTVPMERRPVVASPEEPVDTSPAEDPAPSEPVFEPPQPPPDLGSLSTAKTLNTEANDPEPGPAETKPADLKPAEHSEPKIAEAKTAEPPPQRLPKGPTIHTSAPVTLPVIPAPLPQLSQTPQLSASATPAQSHQNLPPSAINTIVPTFHDRPTIPASNIHSQPTLPDLPSSIATPTGLGTRDPRRIPSQVDTAPMVKPPRARAPQVSVNSTRGGVAVPIDPLDRAPTNLWMFGAVFAVGVMFAVVAAGLVLLFLLVNMNKDGVAENNPPVEQPEPVVEPVPVAAPEPSTVEPSSDAVEPEPSVAEPEPGVAEPKPNVPLPTPVKPSPAPQPDVVGTPEPDPSSKMASDNMRVFVGTIPSSGALSLRGQVVKPDESGYLLLSQDDYVFNYTTPSGQSFTRVCKVPSRTGGVADAETNCKINWDAQPAPAPVPAPVPAPAPAQSLMVMIFVPVGPKLLIDGKLTEPNISTELTVGKHVFSLVADGVEVYKQTHEIAPDQKMLRITLPEPAPKPETPQPEGPSP